MGAFGEDAFANDTALDWMDYPQRAVADIIEKTLRAFVSETKAKLGSYSRRVDQDEAMAAAELLNQLTPYGPRKEDGKIVQVWAYVKGTDFGVHYIAESNHMYSLAVRAVDKLLKDKAWLDCWVDDKAKVKELKRIKKDLKPKVREEDRPVKKQKLKKRKK